jgi:hypothetical protein
MDSAVNLRDFNEAYKYVRDLIAQRYLTEA